eukprot:jgi/Galph1/357/GphlegSOOS_G5116.1
MFQLLNLFLYLYDTYWRACFSGEDRTRDRKESKKRKKNVGKSWEQSLKQRLKFLRKHASKKQEIDEVSSSVSEDLWDCAFDDYYFELVNEPVTEDLRRVSFSSYLATPRRRKALSEEQLDWFFDQMRREELALHQWMSTEE